MILEAILQSLQNFADPQLWLFTIAGIIVGLIFGVIPGIGALQALALFLPFVFVLKPMQAFPFMMAVMASTFSGGSITTVLLGVPGVPGDTATLIDGYPMARKGEAGRALGAALMSSFVGAALTVLLALALVPVILPLAMAIHHADMIFVILVGLTFIGALSTGSRVKGVLSGVMGMIIALVGYQSVTGMERYTFGADFLYDGIPLVPVSLGLFAVPAMIELMVEDKTKGKVTMTIKGMSQVWQGVLDVFRHKMIVMRSMVIAFIAGVTPGVGGSIAAFVSYASAKQASKHPERFGTGIVEGVIAPQTATNGESGGALLTTLALGLPGNPSQALLLAGFIMLGLLPGPEMMTKNLDVSLTLLYILLIGCMIATVICLPLAPYMARIATIPGRILAPLIFVVVFVGSFASDEKVEHLILVIFFSLLGIALSKYGYSRPSLFLGFILGGIFERYLFLSLGIAGPLFFLRPIALSLIFLITLYFCWGPIKNRLQRRRERSRV